MGKKPVDLLGDIGARGKEDGFLMEPVLIEGRTRIHEPRHLFGKADANGLDGSRRIVARREGQLLYPVEMQAEDACEFGTLCLARNGQSVKSFFCAREHRLVSFRDLRLILDRSRNIHNAAQRQQRFDLWRRAAQTLAQSFGEDDNLLQRHFIDCKPLFSPAPVAGQADLDIAAFQIFLRDFADWQVQGLKAGRHAAADVEPLAVDTLDFPLPVQSIKRRRCTSVTCHA